MAGNNDLNILLKTVAAKLMAELDVQGSMNKIKTQVDEISKRLENKPVKLKVELHATVKEMTKQLRKIMSTLESSKSFKPINIKVNIDAKGSAIAIKKQIQEVYKVVDDYNKKYAKQMQGAQKIAEQNAKKASVPTSPIQAFYMKTYVSQVREAKKMMKKQFGEGNFGTFEMKDAQGNLSGFIAKLEQANGIVQQIQYEWNKNAEKFLPINQQTINNVEKHVDKASQSLRSLSLEMEKLKDSKGKRELVEQFKELSKSILDNSLTQDAVKDFQFRVKQEQLIQQEITKENKQLFEQKKLIQEIKQARNRNTSGADIDIRNSYNSIIKNVGKDASVENLREQRLELKKINEEAQKRKKIDSETIANTKKRLQLTQQLRKVQNQTPSKDYATISLIKEIKYMAQRARSAEEWIEVQKKMNDLQTNNANNAMNEKAQNILFKTEQKMRRLVDIGKMTQKEFDELMRALPIIAERNFADLEKKFHEINRKLEQETYNMKRIGDRTVEKLSGSSSELGNIKSAIDAGDIAKLQEYIGTLYKGQVETVKVEQAQDSLGRAVDRLKVKMAGTGKTVKTYTLDLDRANNVLRQTAQGTDYNANRNLGILEQMKIALARVPVWMGAMTAFYGTIHSVQAMTQEILKLDKAMTDLRRVASDGLNVDRLFNNALQMSKELGNNVHDIMEAMNGFARTFGDFNERQLTSITKTAVLMANVSDLTAEEAMTNLVSTMNAFNITAEDSIRIVDSLNQIDNDYAASTKQLAEGLSKSASAAKTFGVSLEENAGHIAGIASVTGESGAIIGKELPM